MSAFNLLSQMFGVNMAPMNPNMMQGGIPGTFRAKYHAYSPAYWSSDNRDKLEKGDKIVLPASALEKLSRMQVQFPIMFEIAHLSEILPKKSHCSVMEFTAPEGSAYLPLWMIDNLGLDATGDSIIELTTVNLPKGNFVQFQAHETQFAMLSNPRVVLEKALRQYSCLTVGDTIQIEFNKYIYKLDVTEVKPSMPRGNAPPGISIIETDIKVDFKEPRDYKEWEKKQKAKNLDLPPGTEFDHVNGGFRQSSGSLVSPNGSNSNLNNNNNSNSNANNNNSNTNGNYTYESKMNDLNNDGLFDNNDDGFMIQDFSTQKAKAKKGYFNTLEQNGSMGQKVKDRRKSNSNKNSNNNNNNVYNSNKSNTYISGGRGAPLGGVKSGKSNRGAPLGVNNNSPMMSAASGGGSSLGGFSLNGNSGGSGKKTTKTEEVIGNMRYIYEVDQFGNRSLIRRLPLRKLPMDTSKGHSLK